jgi:O-antigen/teichoic acid export membrane protein
MTDPSVDESLRARARRAAVWTVAGFGSGQALRFASNLVLTRLLFAEAFGLMALVNSLVMGLHLFSDTGVGPSIVRDRRGADPAFLDTAWSVQVLRGLLLWAIACAAALPFSRFYGEPELASMLPVVAFASVLAGFNSTRLFTLDRNLDQQRVMLIELATQVIHVGTMIGWALVHRSVWALAVGSLASAGAKLALSHVALAGRRHRFHWDPDAAASLFRFGRWVTISTALLFLSGQSDRLIFGRLVPIDSLGVYSIGLMLATFPTALALQLTSRVNFPLLSRVHLAGGPFDREFRRARWPLLVATGWVLAGLTGGGTVAVRLLFDPRYEAAGWVAQILALASWLIVMEAPYRSALLAQGRSAQVAACNAAKLVGMAVLIPLGYRAFDFPGAVAGYAGSELFRYVLAAALAGAPRRLRSLGQDLRLTALMVLISGVAWLAALQLEARGQPALVQAAAVAAVVTLGWLPLGAPMLRRALYARRGAADVREREGAGASPSNEQRGGMR